MWFDHFTIECLGVFAQRQTFDFTPLSFANGTRLARPLVLVRGRNGAGKSTIFQGCALALYGERAARELSGLGQSYQAFLKQLLHHSPSGAPSQGAEVSLHLRVVRQGQPIALEVRRKIERRGSATTERLALLENGVPLAMDPALYQSWLLEQVPLHLFRLCFFDAEQLENLANPERYHAQLQGILDPLVGIERIDLLQHDLQLYARKRARGADAARLQKERDALAGEVRHLETQLSQLQREHDEARQRREAQLDRVREQEQRVNEAGGGYLIRRPWARGRLKDIEREAKELSAEVEEWANGHLPFLLDPERTLQLHRQLLVEEREEQERQLTAARREALGRVEEEIRRGAWLHSLPLTPEVQEMVLRTLLQTVRGALPPVVEDQDAQGSTTPPAERRRLLEMIDQALGARQRIEPLKLRLEELRAEQRLLHAELARSPEEESVQALFDALRERQHEMALTDRRLAALSRQIGSLSFSRNSKRARLREVDVLLRDAQSRESQLSLVVGCQKALQRYQNEARAVHLAHLGNAIAFSFNTLCHKQHFLGQVHVSAEDYRIDLRGADGGAIHVSSFSAGERQLYALSLLWALRLVSRRQLPLLIDTPLARLDREHRDRFAQAYLPHVAEQVVLFATDAEADDQFVRSVEGVLSRLYQLTFEMGSGSTRVSEDSSPVTPERDPEETPTADAHASHV